MYLQYHFKSFITRFRLQYASLPKKYTLQTCKVYFMYQLCFYLISYLIESFKPLPALKDGVLCSGILISSPVLGLRPLRAERLLTFNVSILIIGTFPTLDKLSFMLSNTKSTTCCVFFLVNPVSFAMLFTKSVLFIKYQFPF